jgi:hypothetical protein
VYALVKVLRGSPPGDCAQVLLDPLTDRCDLCGDEGTRTPGLCLAKAPLSQLSYVPASVGLSRLERLTSRLSGECSNQLSYRPVSATLITCGAGFPAQSLNNSSVVGNGLGWGARALPLCTALERR